MTFQILVDVNVPFYAAGAEHELKDASARVIRLIDEYPTRFITDAEVLQEILHRFKALRRWEQGRPVFRSFAAIMAERIEPILAADVLAAAELADRYHDLSARDLLHVAVMQRLGVERVVTADRAFGRIDGITRLDPREIEAWEQDVRAAAP